MKTKIFRPLFFILLVSFAFSHMEGQNKQERPKAYVSAGEYLSLTGEGHFNNMEDLSFTYCFSPKYLWSGTFRLGYSGFPKMKEGNNNFFFGSLGCSFVPIEMNRFRIIPSIGVGVAHGDNSVKKFTRIFFDTSIEAQYALDESMYCGAEYRYMSNGTSSFSFYSLGLKIGFYFR